MLDFEQKKNYGMQHRMQHGQPNWHSGNGYHHGGEAPQMQSCPPHALPQNNINMFMPNGYPNRNNGWSNMGHQASSGEMWHGNGGQPQAVKFSQYHGGRFNGGGTMVEEVDEECYYESKAQEMHYEHNNWGGHNGGMGHSTGMGHSAGMGHRPGHAGMGMNGFSKVSWVAKGL